MLTTRDLQRLLQVDRSTIYRMAESGRLPGVKVGRQWRFPADQIERWLDQTPKGSVSLPVTSAPHRELTALLPPEYVEPLGVLFGEMLGVMMVVTDMEGSPIAEPTNMCGLFEVVNEVPGAVERCVAAWRELATSLDMAHQFQPSHLGLLCARSFVRVGSELKGIILAGGIAPDDWPPSRQEVERMATEFGVEADLMANHIHEVFHLDDAERQLVLSLLPRLSRLLSEIANERNNLLGALDAIAALAGDNVTRSTV